ncbi:hypothetical protein [Butyrivibrio sp. INlla16]|uniref:hypothetical protein n=1 Tax=Butyrivibrio sp. INlla16 TaxID=1520807 RepID=UPI000884DD29|nr:hypothetical protein [Butyrivibrio sp. INlla16]SDB54869.1 hypothetical protein SAMN02910263_02785 [Butyrivibrio sp. INlla16]
MDKTEYKIRAEEIKSLIRAQRFADAVKIADTIDWKRVKSVGMLCAISDLYKVNRRLEESRDILLLAYDRSPTRREIVYSLCELAIAMGEFVQAVEYYKEFVRLAPRNTARYILQYKLYEAQEVSLEERIAVLEEYKKHDYNEKWAYELAYLYHRVGLTTECIEECDELFLYMREGRYVIKALELKALHEPLSPEQKAVYAKYKAETSGNIHAPEFKEAVPGMDAVDGKKAPTRELPHISEEELQAQAQQNYVAAPTQEEQLYNQPVYESQPVEAPVQQALIYEQPVQEPVAEEPIYEAPINEPFSVPTVNVDTYNTVDLQKEIAENLKEVLTENPDAALFADAHGPQVIREEEETGNLDTGDMFETTGDIEKPSMSELFYEDKTYGTEAVQEERAAVEPVTEAPQMQESAVEQNDEPVEEQKEEINTEPVPGTDTKVWNTESMEQVRKQIPEPVQTKTPIAEELKDKEIAANIAQTTMNDHTMYKGVVFMDEPLQDEVPGAVIKPNIRYQINNHFDNMLSQEYDGQISMAIDDAKQVEKQITGQISINEFMSDWERYKKEQQKKQYQSVKKLAASETGELFKDFDKDLLNSALGEEKPKEEPAISGILKPGDEEITPVVKTVKEEISEEIQTEEPVTDEGTEPIEEVISEPAQEETEQVEIAEEKEASSSEEDTFAEASSEEIAPIDDLQNTTSMVQITGEDLEEEASEPEAAEKLVEESEDEEKEAAEIDLGETIEIESAEIVRAEAGLKELTYEKKEEPVEKEMPEASEDIEESEEMPTTEEEPTKEEVPVKAETPKENISKEIQDEPESAEDDEKEDRGIEERVRVMTPEEKGLFGPYIHYKRSRRQIVRAIDNLSMAAYTNNAIVTGEEGAGTVNLAKGLIKAVQQTDSNFSGKVAMITAIKLNKSSVSSILDKIVNGALIIRRAADLKEDTVVTLLKQLQSENKGYILVIEDTRDDIDRLLDKYPDLKKCFNVRVDIEALDDDSLVAYAEQYALEKEHVIDNLGILALHQKISERQTLDHEVTVAEVKEMVDDAIYYADKHSIGHYFDVMLRKRFDSEDMIILREKDFLH